uniref:Reverse transcriptase Ty1/copia-type domain-containing protein n=1 Tax=Strongyloides venezuelensis TaxID=75913 RepID=A0A0K0FJ65_STRVS
MKFKRTTINDIIYSKSEFYIFQKTDPMTMISRVRNVVMQLKKLDQIINDTEMCHIILTKLDTKYDIIKTTLTDSIILENLVQRIKSLSEAMVFNDIGEAFFYVKKKFSSHNGNKNYQIKRNNVKSQLCCNCRETRHQAKSLWIIDSSASVHITNEKFKLSNLRLLDKHIPIKTADDTILDIKECGDFYIDKILVRNVLYSENVTANLPSFAKLTEKGLLVFNGSEYKLKQKDVSIPILSKSGVLIINQKIKNFRVDDDLILIKEVTDLKSITGMACYLNNDLFYWLTKRQIKVARSKFIAELFALVYGTDIILHTGKFVKLFKPKSKLILYTDNLSLFNSLKHVTECLKKIVVMHVNYEEMIADSLTKLLSSERLMNVFTGRGKTLLSGSKLTIYTDHKPLVGLRIGTNIPNYMELLFSVEDQEYELIYKRCHENHTADFLSRVNVIFSIKRFNDVESERVNKIFNQPILNKMKTLPSMDVNELADFFFKELHLQMGHKLLYHIHKLIKERLVIKKIRGKLIRKLIVKFGM